MHDPIVIVGASRTPIGGLLGELKDVTGPELGAWAIQGALNQAKVTPDLIDEVIMGCVLSAGLGQAPARQAALKAHIPDSVSCTTINKMCGSGMKSVMLAHDLLLAGNGQILLAGGLESMTNAPYLLPKARAGYRLGHNQVVDHMFMDGLEDAYEKGQLMGVFAQDCADKYQITREVQDEFAISSLERAQQATKEGLFAHEITPVVISTKTGDVTVSIDEGPQRARIDKIAQLKPAFRKDGTVTAANSSSISDGGAALVLMRLSEAQKRGLTPRAKIVAHSSFAQHPSWFTTAPVGAIKRLLEKTEWSANQVDLFEINEAFAVVTLVAMHELKLPHDKVNVYGGACALGHPIGASGARILVTLLNALEQRQLKRGIASLCIGGGEATAVAIERI